MQKEIPHEESHAETHIWSCFHRSVPCPNADPGEPRSPHNSGVSCNHRQEEAPFRSSSVFLLAPHPVIRNFKPTVVNLRLRLASSSECVRVEHIACCLGDFCCCCCYRCCSRLIACCPAQRQTSPAQPASLRSVRL